MTAWIVYSLFTGALIAVAALGAEWILKSMKRPVRMVWMTAIALTIGLTLTAPLRVETAPVTTGVSISLEDLPMAVPVEPTLPERVAGYAYQLQQTVLAPIHSVTEFASTAGAPLNRAVWMTAAISAIAALVALAGVYRRSMKARSLWPSVRMLDKSVRVTPNVGPAVIGLAPPEIVVPQWVLLRNPEEQRLVLEHESEHVRAHDPMLLMVACIAVATMPWNAAVWFMWSRLRLAVELDCDRRVLNRGVQKASYGQLLVELSSRRPWMAPAIPAFSWGTSHLEQRLVAMTARPKRFRFVRRSASGLLIASALLVATRTELPAATKLTTNDQAALTLTSVTMTEVEAFVPQQDTLKRKPVTRKKAPTVVKKQAKVSKPATDTLSKISNGNRVVYDTVIPRDSSVRVMLRSSDAAGAMIRTPRDSSVRVVYNGEISRVRVRDSAATLYRSDSVNVRDGVVVQGDGTRIMLRKTDTPEVQGERIRVRGQASVSTTNEPLVFVDGVLMKEGSLKLIDPVQIESVEVVKGAKALEVYGPGAANGVINIRMKRP